MDDQAVELRHLHLCEVVVDPPAGEGVEVVAVVEALDDQLGQLTAEVPQRDVVPTRLDTRDADPKRRERLVEVQQGCLQETDDL